MIDVKLPFGELIHHFKLIKKGFNRMTTLVFPNNCNEENIFKFCAELQAQHGVEKITIDFSNMGRIEPFAMIYLAKLINDFKRLDRDISIECRGHSNKQYPANMGFFKAFGLQHGKSPEQGIRDTDNFIPFTILDMQTIKDEAAQQYTVGQEIIEKRALHLAEVLSRQEKTDLVEALNYSIREIIRNVYEHSSSIKVAYCAQYWPTYHKVEIAIADNGIGLRESLSKNPFIDAKSDSEAIQLALMPAISSKNYKGRKVNASDPWHNSGYGLYMSSRICSLGGSFLVCSGNHAIKLNEEGKTHYELDHICKGTVIRMVLDTNKLTELSTMLGQFREEGYKIARDMGGIGSYSASAASKMLSKDFKKTHR